MMARKRGRIINMTGGGTATSFPNGSGYATSKAGLLRFTECVSDSLAGSGVLVFAMDPGLVRTAMTEYQLSSEAGQTHLPNIPRLFEIGVDVPPTLAARLSVEIGSGRFDRLAGRMLMAARGDLDLSEADIDGIVAADLRSLRVNGMPRSGRAGLERACSRARRTLSATASTRGAGQLADWETAPRRKPRTPADRVLRRRPTEPASRSPRSARACGGSRRGARDRE